MMGPDVTVALVLRLEPDQDAGVEELERLTQRLRRELLQLDVDEVRRCDGDYVPAGARGIDPGAIGSLLVSLVSGPELFRAVVSVVTGWLGRTSARSVHIEIDGDVLDVKGVSSTGQDRLIEEWLSRRAPR
jgi:hypothetical protein